MVALMLLGMGVWFFWDGLVGYPFSNQRWDAHEKFVTEKRLDDWPAYAKSRNWSQKEPHKRFTQGDINGQFVCGSAGFLIGLLVLAYWWREKGRTVCSDESAIYTPLGQRVPYEAIVSVDAKHWESKGLATVHYRVDGRDGKFKLDDYKYSMEPMRQIMRDIEAKRSA